MKGTCTLYRLIIYKSKFLKINSNDNNFKINMKNNDLIIKLLFCIRYYYKKLMIKILYKIKLYNENY
jgi:hypothetical protein